MDKNFILLEFLFFASVLANLLLKNNLYLKILLIVLYTLFFIKLLPTYKLNKNKYIFVNINFIIILILFIIIGYFKTFEMTLIVGCYLILFLYLSRVIFNTTFGVVVLKDGYNISVELKDVFYKFKKRIILKSKKKMVVGSKVIIKLSNFPLFKKPISILKVIDESK
jgi:hypothetical protein